jgi:outer membrane murein-binding lipoprotein Lpp
MIKHRIAISLAVGIILGLFVIAYNYRQVRKDEISNRTQIATLNAKKQSLQSDLQVKSQIYTAVYVAVKNQCSRDMTAYKALAPSVQAKVPTPICNVQ